MGEVTTSEQLWRLTVERSPVGMTLVSPDGRLLSANRALCQMLGYSEQELRQLSFQQITHPEDLAADVTLYEETLAGVRSSYRMVKRYLRSDGHVVWGDLSVALLRDDNRDPIHFIAQILDITEQREDQTRLASALELIDEQHRRAEAILDTVDVGLVLLDREGRYQTMNRRHHQFMALAFADGHAGAAGQLGAVYSADGTRLLSGEEMPSFRAARGEEFDDVQIWVGRDPLVRRAVSVSARTVRDQDGRFAGAALAYKDVTDLVRALQVKDDFVAGVSHELRTPLASVLGHLELLCARDDLPPDTAPQLDAALRNAVRLRRLVDDLISSAEIQDGKLQLEIRPTDLTAVVVEAVEAAQVGAVARGIAVDLHAPDRLVIGADRDRLRQVVDNLLLNAVKYTDAGGRVAVSLLEEADQVRLEVTDTGIGIAEADLTQVFTRFFRTRAARRRPVAGVGLGLNIADALVAAHGGMIEVESTPGEGSCFRVTLPRSTG